MSTHQLYDTWYEEMSKLRPAEHTSRLRSFVGLLVGLFLVQSVHISQIGKKIPGPATNKSKERRMLRILDNPAIRVRSWYAPWITAVLDQIAAHDMPVRLIIDGSKVGFGQQLLMVAVAYRRRAIPVAWTWVKGSRGHSSSGKQLALLSYVRSLLPAGATISLVGDSEFGAIPVWKWSDKAHWLYVVRQKGNPLVQLPQETLWRRFDSLISRGGPRVWIPQARLTEKHTYEVNLLADWKSGETEPWLLATNFPTLRAALRAYRKRMWSEEMFGDFKGHGFDLESTQLHNFRRLSRLTLAVVLLYLWLVAYGSKVIKDGRRYLVDRQDRRDLSIFRIGWDMIDRHLTNQEAFVFRWLPYF